MEKRDWPELEDCWFNIVVYKIISFCQKTSPLQTLIRKDKEVDKKRLKRNHGRMSESLTSKELPLTPIGYTALAVGISLFARSVFMPYWSPVEEPTRELSFFIFWMMSVLPILYLSFRYWAEDSLKSFMPQVFVFLALSFVIQVALNAVSMAFGLLQIPHSALMPFVWALPWLALTTKWKHSYVTPKQCKFILLVTVPLALLFHSSYLFLPAFVLAYGSLPLAAASLFGMVALFYGVSMWCLIRNVSRA